MSVTTISHIIKRNSKREEFDVERIKNAIKKAFFSQGYLSNQVPEEIPEEVMAVVNVRFSDQQLPHVEQIQDIVEDVLSKKSYNDVAKAYILYREDHKRIREEKVLSSIKEKKLEIKSDDGKSFVFSEAILKNRLETLAQGLNEVNTDEILEQVCRGLYQDMLYEEIHHLCLKEVEARMDRHYDYSKLSSRLILDELYKNILGSHFGSDNLDNRHQERFPEYIHIGIQEEMLDSEMGNFNLDVIKEALVQDRDMNFYYLGMQTLYDRYLLKNRNKDTKKKKIFELPQWMWMRVAMGLALKEENREERAIEFYNVLSNFYLISSTPTLFNSGTLHMQLSSCYINTVGDSLSDIFKNFSDDAQLSKWAGGIGTDWTRVRATGSSIHGTNGVSSGIIPFIKIFNDIAIAVNQGGKRRGAMAAYLENWHLDIEEFVELKKNTGDERRRAHDIHPACFISDLFLKRVRSDEEWTLFSPDDTPELHNLYGSAFEKKYIEYEANPPVVHKKIKAKDLWRKTLTMLYETGHPWITFKDPINVRSPQDHQGVIHSSNLCTEITLNTSLEETAVCNLASVNMSRMIRDGKLDRELIASTVTTGMRMLDNVIDINYYPTVEAKRSNLRHRPVGLGMMGYHDALFQMGITYSSERQVEFADESMEMISYHALLASSKLAKERGSYETYDGSKWSKGILPLDSIDILEKERGEEVKVPRSYQLDWKEVRNHIAAYGMRNSNCMAIAPTATISNIAGVVPCVEPIYSNIFMQENLSGSFYVVNRYLIDRLKERGLWIDEIVQEIKGYNGSIQEIDAIPDEIKEEFRDVLNIDQTWLVKSAARRAKWIDQSASTNLFIDTRSGDEIDRIYQMCWEMGLKTTYYLRTKAASQVTKTTNSWGSKEKTTTEISAKPAQACSLDGECESCQ